MNKIIVLLAVLASTGCAGFSLSGGEASGDVALIGGGPGHAGGGDVTSAPARVAVREPVREISAPPHANHRDAEFVVCAQCRR
jgi:hypothetical protein